MSMGLVGLYHTLCRDPKPLPTLIELSIDIENREFTSLEVTSCAVGKIKLLSLLVRDQKDSKSSVVDPESRDSFNLVDVH